MGLKVVITEKNSDISLGDCGRHSSSGIFTEEELRLNRRGIKGPASSDGLSEASAGSPERAGAITYDALEVLNELGAGSSGSVVRVRHRPTGCCYAMKTLTKLDEKERRQVLQEVRALHASSHPSIVGFIDAFYADGRVCMLLELMAASLQNVVERVGFVPELVMAKLTEPLLQGLHYLHKTLHIVHRDIKPANILVSAHGEVKIADFGVSGKLASTIGLKQTFVGTATYMSPERILGTPHSSNADIWSLGLTLMECALGRYPYGQCDTFFLLLDLIQESPSPSLPADQFSPEFQAFIDSCLIKDHLARPTADTLLRHPLILKTRADTDTNVSGWFIHSIINDTNQV